MPEPADLKSQAFYDNNFDPTYPYRTDREHLESYQRGINILRRDLNAALNVLQGQLALEIVKSQAPAPMSRSLLLGAPNLNMVRVSANSSLNDFGVRLGAAWYLGREIVKAANPVASPMNIQGTLGAILRQLGIKFEQLSRPGRIADANANLATNTAAARSGVAPVSGGAPSASGAISPGAFRTR